MPTHEDNEKRYEWRDALIEKILEEGLRLGRAWSTLASVVREGLAAYEDDELLDEAERLEIDVEEESDATA